MGRDTHGDSGKRQKLQGNEGVGETAVVGIGERGGQDQDGEKGYTLPVLGTELPSPPQPSSQNGLSREGCCTEGGQETAVIPEREGYRVFSQLCGGDLYP